MNEIAPEITVDSVREQLRQCLLSLSLEMAMHEVQSGKENAVHKETVGNIAAFGCNAGLITKDEYDDWCSVIQDSMKFGTVSMKWMKA